METITRHWPLFIAGAVLFVLGPIIMMVQVNLYNLGLPWHVPILATLGVLLMAASVWRRRGIGRTVALGLCALLCGGEWYLILVGMRTPEYAGPATIDHSIPEFATTLADGTPFTDQDLTKGKPTLLVFFRGRW